MGEWLDIQVFCRRAWALSMFFLVLALTGLGLAGCETAPVGPVGGQPLAIELGDADGVGDADASPVGATADDTSGDAATDTDAATIPAPAPSMEPVTRVVRAPAQDAEADQVRNIAAEHLIQRGDRFLFIGDDMTQQMFYTRAAAAGLLSVFPDRQLQFFNGGWTGATAASANDWVDDLMTLAKPTVVYICLGFNDALGASDDVAMVRAYREGLGELVDRVAGYQHTRMIFVMSPPAVQTGRTSGAENAAVNVQLGKLAEAARATALDKSRPDKVVAYLDIFQYMAKLYEAAAASGGDRLTIGRQLPSEPAHVVIASMILWSLNVRSEQLQAVGYSPLRPVEMGRIRQAMALKTTAASYEQGRVSRNLYEGIRHFDEKFFRYWRLAGRFEQGPRSRRHMAPELRRIWRDIQSFAYEYYGEK